MGSCRTLHVSWLALALCSPALADDAVVPRPLAERALAPANALAPASTAEPRFNLELSGRNENTRLASGVLRFQLSETSTLALRPRGGGLVIAFRSQF
jgi:hypothetical protein